ARSDDPHGNRPPIELAARFPQLSFPDQTFGFVICFWNLTEFEESNIHLYGVLLRNMKRDFVGQFGPVGADLPLRYLKVQTEFMNWRSRHMDFVLTAQPRQSAQVSLDRSDVKIHALDCHHVIRASGHLKAESVTTAGTR